MSTKRLFILFLILYLLPVFIGKASLAPFAAFFEHISWEGFKTAFLAVWRADWNFYLGWLSPWIEKLKDLIKGSIPQTLF